MTPEVEGSPDLCASTHWHEKAILEDPANEAVRGAVSLRVGERLSAVMPEAAVRPVTTLRCGPEM